MMVDSDKVLVVVDLYDDDGKFISGTTLRLGEKMVIDNLVISARLPQPCDMRN